MMMSEKCWRADVGEEQRRILELIEVVVAVALLQPVELLLEDPGEGRAHLARAERRLREAADEQVDVVDVDVFLAVGGLEQRQELGLLGGRAAQVRAELRPGRVGPRGSGPCSGRVEV